jgi:hypothetical protein
MERLRLGRNFTKMQSIRFLMLAATLFLSANRLRADIDMDSSCPASPAVTTLTFFFMAGPTGGSCLPGHNASAVSWTSLEIITTEVAGKTLFSDYPCQVGVSLPFSSCGVRIDFLNHVRFSFSGGSGISNVGLASEFAIDLQTHPIAPGTSPNAPGMWGAGHVFEAVACGTDCGTELALDDSSATFPLNPTPEPSYLGLLILLIGALVIYRRAGGRHRGTT